MRHIRKNYHSLTKFSRKYFTDEFDSIRVKFILKKTEINSSKMYMPAGIIL